MENEVFQFAMDAQREKRQRIVLGALLCIVLAFIGGIWIGEQKVDKYPSAKTMDDLLHAIAIVESNKDVNALGQCGEVGVYQVTDIFKEDVERLLSYDVRWSPHIMEGYIKVYWFYYGDTTRLGRPATLEDYARMFYGGPDGYDDPATEWYWNKVKGVMYGQ